MSEANQRAMAALGDIAEGLKSVGDSFATLAAESAQSRGAVVDLGAKLDKLQATADEIKAAVADNRGPAVTPSH